MSDRRWDDERSGPDAPVWLNAEEAIAWAAGWNAAVRECVEQQDAALAAESIDGSTRSTDEVFDSIEDDRREFERRMP